MINMSLAVAATSAAVPSVAGTSGLHDFAASAFEAGQAILIVLSFASLHGWVSAGLGVAGTATLFAMAAALDDADLLTLVAGDATQCLLGIAVAAIGLRFLVCAIGREPVDRFVCRRNETHASDRRRLHAMLSGVALPALGVVACLVLIGRDTLSRAMALYDAQDEVGVVLIGVMAAVINLSALAALVTMAAPPATSDRSMLTPLMAIGLGAMLVSAGVFNAGVAVGVRWPAGESTMIVLVTIPAALAALAARIGSRAASGRRSGTNDH